MALQRSPLWLGLSLLLWAAACSNPSGHDEEQNPAQPGTEQNEPQQGDPTKPADPLVPGPDVTPSKDAGGTPGAADSGPGKPPRDDKPQSFQSDLPTAATGGAAGGGADAGVATTGAGGFTGGAAPTADSNGAATAERAIVEADIVQMNGTQLYALSRVAGLSVIDVSDPRNLRLQGSYRRLSGTPFEMYLRDGVAIVMFSSWGQYVRQSDDSYSWVQTSKVVALDVANPAAIQEIGSFDLAGEVSDSRLVGDVLYVVGYQNGYCWSCTQNKQLTTVLSLNVQNPRAITRVDELRYDNGSSGGRRSIAVTTQRIYVAGPEYGSGQTQPTGSTIQVVDISNPNGDLVTGAEVKVAGQINNRWQMDEYQNVLRVISQPWPWSTPGTVPPSVQTFTVVSSQQLTALGRTEIRMPANEQLQSVRFDGPRGYAITAIRTDPLFTIDLSNPARPRQVGELEMPGFLYHMEPRGDRLIGLGYDQGNPQGAITVSIFDVSNLATPRMLSRVNFGGDWAHLPEDQDRIHKSFKVLDALGLILVPFSGWTNWRNPGYCSSSYRSGVQLVDFANDTLTARGVTPSRGEARRALVQGSTLLTVSDEAVDTFDLSNRTAPAALGQLVLARNVSHALPLSNGHVARINQDWYSQNSSIDFVPLADAEKPGLSVGQVNLSDALHTSTEPCNYNAWIQEAYVSGTQINVTFSSWNYSDTGGYIQNSGLLTIDASNPAAPTLASRLLWTQSYNDLKDPNYSAWGQFYSYYQYGYIGTQNNAVRTDSALVTLEQRSIYNTNAGTSTTELRLRVIDLRDPKAPSVSTVALPKAGGYAGLVADGPNVLLSHYDRVDGTSAGRFYVDRVDLTDPKQPKLTDKLNVPGALLHYDRKNGRAVTSELKRTVVQNILPADCYKRFAYADFLYTNYTDGTPKPSTCTGYVQHLQLVRFVPGGAVLEDTHQLGERDRISSSSLGDGRVVSVLSHGYAGWWYGGWGPVAACFGCGGYYGGGSSSEPAEALVLGGLDTGTFEVGRVTVDDSALPWWGFYGSLQVYANGTRALFNGQNDAIILDTSVASAPKIARSVPLYGYVRRFDASGNLALLALGMNGVQRIDL